VTLKYSVPPSPFATKPTLSAPVQAPSPGATTLPPSAPPLTPPAPVVLVGAVKEFKIAGTLQSLANIAQKVNDLSDRLTDHVSEVESAINKFNLGVYATVIAETTSEDGTYVRIIRLAYGKSTGRWGFVIEDFIDQDPENSWQSWAFKEAPRELRLKVIERIPQLLDELVTKSSSLASDISDKIKMTKDLVECLSQPSPSGSKK
jgi:hypothetical protein